MGIDVVTGGMDDTYCSLKIIQMKTNFRWSFLLLVAFSWAIFFACSKDDSMNGPVPPGKQQLSVYLTDNPAFFDQVLIDIQSVSVLVDTCKSRNDKDDDDDDNDNQGNNDGDDDNNRRCYVWDSLDIRPGVYDLLTLRNGVDTLFANGVIPDGKIKKIRIKLGTQNSLVKDSITYPLNLPRGMDVITLTIRGADCEEFEPGRVRFWLDFDAGRSIVVLRNNQFQLRPVIRVFIPKSTGSIEGRVLPGEAAAVISVFNSSDTAYALPFREGKFKIRGLNEGTYSVFFNASNGYRDTTITNVEVKQGRETKLNTITLTK